MTNTQYVGELLLRFQIRCPASVEAGISELARVNRNSRNSEILIALERHISSAKKTVFGSDYHPHFSRQDFFVAAALSGISERRVVQSKDLKAAIKIASQMMNLIDRVVTD